GSLASTSNPRITKGVDKAAVDRGAIQGGYHLRGTGPSGPTKPGHPATAIALRRICPPPPPLPPCSPAASPKPSSVSQVTMPGDMHAARLTTPVRRPARREAWREERKLARPLPPNDAALRVFGQAGLQRALNRQRECTSASLRTNKAPIG